MERDLDKKLYNDYLSGEKQAFEYLYNKYKSKIVYFIFNIVKDYEKAEDLAQETFIYIMQNPMKNPMKNDVSFKYYVYLVAKSKAFNYRNIENRRNEIAEEYLSNNKQIENDVLDVITKEESKKELLDAIELLDEKYKNAIYLVNIENLSYKETADILGETLSNTKSLVHRGKKQLRKILLKKGFDEMNKVAKVFVIILCASVLLTGITYAGMIIYNQFIKKQDEVKSRGLFDLGDGRTYYEIDLMANDMTWNEKPSLYHRIIDNITDYEKYKSRVNEFPNADEIDFNENFVVVIANENTRQPHEKDLTIYNITADENTTHIIMKQKENPDYNAESNIWYAIVDKSLLRESADVIIEQRIFNTGEYKDIEELPKDYSVENAIEDGCIVLQNNKVVSKNIDKLDDFIKETENNVNSFIRIYTNYKSSDIDEIRVKDIEYYNGIFYYRDVILNDEDKDYYYSSTSKLVKSNTKLGTLYAWADDSLLIGSPVIIVIQK